jgi:hypothetical protein
MNTYKLFFRVIFLSLIIVSISYIAFLYQHQNPNKEKEVNMAFQEIQLIAENFDYINAEIYKSRVFSSLVGFMSGITLEEAKKNQSNLSYSLEDLGFQNTPICEISISINETEEIKCSIKSNGDFIFNRNKDRSWSCKYIGNTKYKPLACSNKIDFNSTKQALLN